MIDIVEKLCSHFVETILPHSTTHLKGAGAVKSIFSKKYDPFFLSLREKVLVSERDWLVFTLLQATFVLDCSPTIR